MRKQVQMIAAAALLALLSAGASAQSADSALKFRVPFGFEAGGRAMPAGDYVVTLLGRDAGLPAVLVKSADGREARMLRATPVEARRARESAAPVFSRHGGRHFLAQVWVPGERAGPKVRRPPGARRVSQTAGRAEAATVELTAGK